MPNFLHSIEQLPIYLSDTEKYKLFQDINKNYPNIDYYALTDATEFWQGDGWSKFDIYDFNDAKLKIISGLILSNTCDIYPENKRIIPNFINFCLVMNIKSYEDFLKSKNIDAGSIKDHIDAIKRQAVSTRFYLPPQQRIDYGYVALLDHVYTLPLNKFLENTSKKLHLRLSQAGFYIFLIKLSWHFCRMGEGIHRDSIFNA